MYKCIRCGVVKKQKNDLRRHYKRKNMCKPLINNICYENCLQILNNPDTNFEEIDELKEQNKILQEQLKELHNQMKELIGKIGNNNTTINITTNNYNVNDYKNTNYNVISNTELNNCIRNGKLDIVKLFKTIHFNEKYPENHNIKVENATAKRVMVLEDKKFIEKGRGYNILNKVINEEINKIERNVEDNDKMEIAIDKYLTNCETEVIDKKKESKKLFNLMYNKKDMINDTYNKNTIICERDNK